MRLTLFCVTSLSLFWAFIGTSPANAALEKCESLIKEAENKSILESNPYDICEFNNEKIVWEKWAPFAAQNQLKRALYEICIRYPEHIYHDIYCEKSAALGYGPALALKAENLFQKGDEQTAVKWSAKAIETEELSQEQLGRLLEKTGVFYYQKNNPLFQSYLEQAATRRSALANHLLSVIAYARYTGHRTLQNEKTAFNYIWRAILLGCPNAEENLGLFHLARQKKITPETALYMMKQKSETCVSSAEEEVQRLTEETEMYQCKCKTAIRTEQTHREKPYLLINVNGDEALLEDAHETTFSVHVEDNLPDQGKVAEIHQSAVVIKYPKERVIISLYKPDKCAAFCQKNGIEENLSPEAMEKHIKGNANITIQPYHLSFTPQECETLLYYAPELVDTDLPFVGKNECNTSNTMPRETTLLDKIKMIEEKNQASITPEQESAQSEQSAENQIDVDKTKKRFKMLGADLIESELN